MNIDFLEIENLVNSMLSAKRLASDANMTSLEQQMDLLIYHLYGLTYDEVLIVDPQTPITSDENEKV